MRKLFTLILAASSVMSMAAVDVHSSNLNPTSPQNLPGEILHGGVKMDSRLTDIMQNSTRLMLPESDDVIYNPEGTTTYYDVTTEGYFVYNYQRYAGINTGAGEIVWGENNEVYICNPILTNVTGAFIKGTVEGNKISVQLPQVVDNYDYYGSVIKYYVTKMKPVMEYSEYYNQDIVVYYPVADEENIATWTINDDGSITYDCPGGQDMTIEDPYNMTYCVEGTIGICYQFPGEDMRFANTCDWSQEYIPFDPEAATLQVPESVEFESWYYNDVDGASRIVEIGFEGSDVYLKNFTNYAPEATIKGGIAEGVISFPDKQYLGYSRDLGSFFWFMAGRGEVIDDGSDMNFDIIPQIDFKYDAEGKKMWVEGDDAIFISSLTTRLYYWTYSLSPEIQYQTAEQTNAAPQAPTLEFYEEWWEYGYLTMAWSIPTVNVNGYTLPTSQMYYNLYFDGEVYEFSPDVHWFFTEEISDIPYNFTDQYDILLDGMIHEFYIYDQGIEDIGMESVYVAEDGTEYRSERTTAHIENGVVSVRDISLNPVVSVSYHNISGVKINNPKNGLYIKTTVYADGSRESKKVMIR